MERNRTVAAAPVRSAAAAWDVVVTLLKDTIERSPEVPEGSVSEALACLVGLGPALVAAGHLETDRLVLNDDALRLNITVATGDAALSIEENLNPVPGGAQTSDRWMLHLPPSGPLGAAVADAISGSAHLSADPPPVRSDDEGGSLGKASVDLDAVRLRGGTL